MHGHAGIDEIFRRSIFQPTGAKKRVCRCAEGRSKTSLGERIIYIPRRVSATSHTSPANRPAYICKFFAKTLKLVRDGSARRERERVEWCSGILWRVEIVFLTFYFVHGADLSALKKICIVFTKCYQQYLDKYKQKYKILFCEIFCCFQ